jgi:hypothetical protein
MLDTSLVLLKNTRNNAFLQPPPSNNVLYERTSLHEGANAAAEEARRAQTKTENFMVFYLQYSRSSVRILAHNTTTSAMFGLVGSILKPFVLKRSRS